MDNMKFGGFLAERRKEKNWTQKDLAERLNVTDKAVSKWERGLGFPDIKLIEPLAEALEVSILELIRSECIPEEARPTDSGPEIVSEMVDLAVHQRAMERKNTALAVLAAAAGILILYLIDWLEVFDPVMFFFTVFPALCWGIALVLFFLYCKRRRQHCSQMRLLIYALFLFAAPVILLCFIFLLVLFAWRHSVL